MNGTRLVGDGSVAMISPERETYDGRVVLRGLHDPVVRRCPFQPRGMVSSEVYPSGEPFFLCPRSKKCELWVVERSWCSFTGMEDALQTIASYIEAVKVAK